MFIHARILLTQNIKNVQYECIFTTNYRVSLEVNDLL